MPISKNLPRCSWGGLEFNICSYHDPWNDVGGVYIFAKRASDFVNWEAIRVGMTHSFKERLTHHPDWAQACIYGASHVHVRIVQNKREREELETRLIGSEKPPMNKQRK